MGTRLIAAAALATAAHAPPACADWQSVESARGDRMERIEFEKGTKPGQIHYRRNPVHDEVPGVLAVGPAGELYVIEPSLNRIQAFGPDGRLLSLLTAADVQGVGEFLNVFPVAPYRAKVLVAVKAAKGDPGRHGWFTYRSDRKSISESLAVLPVQGAVSASFLDREGFLWLQGAQWTVVSPDGNSIAGRVAQDGTYVDGNGLLFVPGNALRLFDKLGRALAEVKFESDVPVEIKGGDLGTYLYGLEASLLQAKGASLRERSNTLVLLRFDRGASLLRARRLALPPTVLSYPTPNPDFMVPVQMYLSELSVLAGSRFYIMGHSNDKYRIDRIELANPVR